MNPALLALALLVVADDGPRRLDVTVGATVEVEVGYAIGFLCDDTKILSAEMKAKNDTTNVFVVKGVAPGTTLCRVGTEPQRPSILFQVHVVPRPKR